MLYYYLFSGKTFDLAENPDLEDDARGVRCLASYNCS
jgi:hypothetical protein